MIEQGRDEELRVNLSDRLNRLKVGQTITIRGDQLRRLWPEQSEEELGALCNTNDLQHSAKLFATAHGCEHQFNGDGDVTFIKGS